MPEKYVKEMLCDWRWVGRAFAKTEKEVKRYNYCKRSEVYNWYYKRADAMVLHENTRKYIHKFLQNEKRNDRIDAWWNWWYGYFGDFYDLELYFDNK